MASKRKGHDDNSASTRFRVDRDRCLVDMRNPARDREPEPGPGRATMCRVASIEAVEDARQLFCVDADTGVRDRNTDLPMELARRDIDAGA